VGVFLAGGAGGVLVCFFSCWRGGGGGGGTFFLLSVVLGLGGVGLLFGGRLRGGGGGGGGWWVFFFVFCGVGGTNNQKKKKKKPQQTTKKKNPPRMNSFLHETHRAFFSFLPTVEGEEVLFFSNILDACRKRVIIAFFSPFFYWVRVGWFLLPFSGLKCCRSALFSSTSLSPRNSPLFSLFCRCKSPPDFPPFSIYSRCLFYSLRFMSWRLKPPPPPPFLAILLSCLSPVANRKGFFTSCRGLRLNT